MRERLTDRRSHSFCFASCNSYYATAKTDYDLNGNVVSERKSRGLLLDDFNIRLRTSIRHGIAINNPYTSTSVHMWCWFHALV